MFFTYLGLSRHTAQKGILRMNIVIVGGGTVGSAICTQLAREDHNITAKIKEATSLFDIQLLDHIIISTNDSFSFKSNGLI